MDNPAERKGAKKHRLREKRATAHISTAARDAATLNLSNPPATDPSATTNIDTNSFDSISTATLGTSENITPWDSSSDTRQEAGNYYLKQQLRTAPIAVYAIVEPNTATHISIPNPMQNPATSSASAYDDMDSIEKIDAELARMERDWAENRAGPFPEGVRNAFEDLRAEQAKQDTKSAQAENDIRHVTTTAAISTTTIPAPASTAIPATTTTTATDSKSAITKIEQQGDEEPEVRREEEGNGVEKADRASKRKTER
jgi:hypothetical protein